jgi:hypothetical protein
MPRPELNAAQQEILLVEYQKAVDTVQHFDTLMWTFIGLISAGIAALFGLAIQSDCRTKGRLLIAGVGFLLSILLSAFTKGFADIAQIARERGFEIEKMLGMKLQLNIRDQYPVPIMGIKIYQKRVIYGLSFVACIGWALFLGYVALYSCSSAGSSVQEPFLY